MKKLALLILLSITFSFNSFSQEVKRAGYGFVASLRSTPEVQYIHFRDQTYQYVTNYGDMEIKATREQLYNAMVAAFKSKKKTRFGNVTVYKGFGGVYVSDNGVTHKFFGLTKGELKRLFG